MVSIQHHASLLPCNTFGIDVMAHSFCTLHTVEDLRELIVSPAYRGQRVLMLGAGSNVLFTKDFDGLVLKMNIKGITRVTESDDHILVKSFAGERWHDLVMHCVGQDLGGIENLSLIPGTVGAAPIQNIGAYGVEVGSVIEKVEGIDSTTGQVLSFTKEECRFGYRESAFKGEWKEKIFISSVTLSLTKKNHLFNVGYGALQETLKQQHVTRLSVKAVSDAVIQIRQQKLPDPSLAGNAGSFFKNPTITVQHYEKLKIKYPVIPSYPIDSQYVKVPAGWLIEQCGWKGKRIGNVGVHPHQALVLVHYGGGTGEEILQLSLQISSSVKEKFEVVLTPEVNIF